MLKDKQVLQLDDDTAGSSSKKIGPINNHEIARLLLKPKKYNELIFRIVIYYAPNNILEIGTSFGVTTSYLAAANENAMVYTLEEVSAIAAIAKSNFEKLGLNNISTIIGNLDFTLPAFLEGENSLDFVFVKGNHVQQLKQQYFKRLLLKLHENSIVVIDAIHTSEEMEAAWKEIQEHPQVRLTIDLFSIGLVFFRIENKVKQHFSINF
jgi:predicted O-methyltransferase YrrM